MRKFRENPKEPLFEGLSFELLQSQEEAVYVNIAVERERERKLDTAGYSFIWQRTAMALPSFCLWQHKLLYLKSHSFLKLQWTCFHQQSSSGGKNYFIS